MGQITILFGITIGQIFNRSIPQRSRKRELIVATGYHCARWCGCSVCKSNVNHINRNEYLATCNVVFVAIFVVEHGTHGKYIFTRYSEFLRMLQVYGSLNILLIGGIYLRSGRDSLGSQLLTAIAFEECIVALESHLAVLTHNFFGSKQHIECCRARVTIA